MRGLSAIELEAFIVADHADGELELVRRGLFTSTVRREGNWHIFGYDPTPMAWELHRLYAVGALP